MVNVKPVKLGNTERMSFGKIDEVIDMPNLIEVQKASYICRLAVTLGLANQDEVKIPKKGSCKAYTAVAVGDSE